MRILVIPSWYPPLGGGFFQEYCEFFAKNGIEVTVLTLDIIPIKKINFRRLLNRDKISILNENGVTVVRSDYYKIPKFEKLNALLWAKSTERLAHFFIRKLYKPDLILAQSALWAGLPAMNISLKYNIPLIINEHRSRLIGNNPFSSKLLKKWHLPLLKQIYSNCDHIITVSKALNEGIKSYFSPTATIQIIGNFIDHEFFNISPDNELNSEFSFITIAALEYYKGIDILLYAFSQFIKRHSNSTLKIVGDGVLKNELQKLCVTLNIQHNVMFLGQLAKKEIVNNLNNTNVFILPSRFEAFGIVIIEALACGVPVICTKSGGPEDIVNDDKLGFLIDCNNPESLDSVMEKLYINYAFIDKSYLRQNVISRFGVNIIMTEYLKTFEKIVSFKNISHVKN